MGAAFEIDFLGWNTILFFLTYIRLSLGIEDKKKNKHRNYVTNNSNPVYPFSTSFTIIPI